VLEQDKYREEVRAYATSLAALAGTRTALNNQMVGNYKLKIAQAQMN
jgi:hypothetical protein